MRIHQRSQALFTLAVHHGYKKSLQNDGPEALQPAEMLFPLSKRSEAACEVLL